MERTGSNLSSATYKLGDLDLRKSFDCSVPLFMCKMGIVVTVPLKR